MESYTDFATVYDTFMDETPYHEWALFIHELIQKYGISQTLQRNIAASDEQGDDVDVDRDMGETSSPDEIKTQEQVVDIDEALDQERNMVVDLGCGTGTFTQELYDLGYDMVGIDLSGEMLNIAQEKRVESGREILYLEQDMREIDLFCTAGTFVSVCDSINYLTDPEDVVETMKRVNNYLFPDGIFIFDFNTLHKYRDVIGDTTISEDRDECAFIWDNWFDEENHINEYDVTIFVREKADLYRKFTETHYQRGYTLDEMIGLVKESGLEFVTAIDADSHEDPDDDSQRIYIVARKGKDANNSHLD